MKREYASPNIIFESFSLNSSIALSCAVKTHTPEQGACGFEFEGVIVFTEQVAGCVKDGIVIEDSVNNGFCYHVPTGTNNLFNS